MARRVPVSANLGSLVGSTRRAELLPEVPTLAESSVPGFDASTVSGVFVPIGDADLVRLQCPHQREQRAARKIDPHFGGCRRGQGALDLLRASSRAIVADTAFLASSLMNATLL